MMYFCFARNIHDVLVGGNTAYKNRFGIDFPQPANGLITFGAEVEYKPISQKDLERLHSCGKKRLPRLFIGYHQQEGGGWSGDVEVIDWEELEQATEARSVKVKRFKAQEVKAMKYNGEFRYPLAEGDLDQPGFTRRDLKPQKEKRKKEQQEREKREKERVETQRQLELDLGSDPSADLPAKQLDFWTCNADYLIRHHVEPRTELFVPTDANSPIPLKYLDILRCTITSLPDLKESEIEDYWTDPAKANLKLSSSWTGRTKISILRPAPPDGWTCFVFWGFWEFCIVNNMHLRSAFRL